MHNYLDLIQTARNKGVFKKDRTGVGCYSLFGYQLRFDLAKGFPLLTTKKLHWQSIVYELLWFIRGDTNVRYLQDHGVSIWNHWADAHGDLGPIYGHQWRSWPSDNGAIDQLKQVIASIQNNPHSRRLIVSSWNVSQLSQMALPPCHLLFQFYVAEDKLSCQLYQRSADLFLGVPFNIASYALLTMMVAQVTGLKLGEFIHSFGDVHLYTNHLPQVAIQLARTPRGLPQVSLNPQITNIDDFQYEDCVLHHYDPFPHIKAQVAV